LQAVEIGGILENFGYGSTMSSGKRGNRCERLGIAG
jgi:hypothetical protein